MADRIRREVSSLHRSALLCNTRANLVTADQVRLLKAAGCHSVSMGIESGNDRIRNELLKRQMSQEQLLEAARLLREGGLRFAQRA